MTLELLNLMVRVTSSGAYHVHTLEHYDSLCSLVGLFDLPETHRSLAFRLVRHDY
jgi:hypothetical protein